MESGGLACALALGLAVACGGRVPGPAPDHDRPNVVLLVVDDLASSDPGFMGNDFHRTPHMDRLAREGTVFEQAYAAAPNCAPSRESLLTGQVPARHGIVTVQRRQDEASTANEPRADGSFVGLAEAFHAAGYATALIGKWHRRDSARDHGFELVLGREELGYEPGAQSRPAREDDVRVDRGLAFLVDELTDEAIAFVDSATDRPFFLYLAHHAMHLPLDGPEELVIPFRERTGEMRYNNPGYAGMLAHLDLGIGRLLEHLDARGLSDRTLIVLTSDNGGARLSRQAVLRGQKATLYEGGIRVPLVVRWTGHFPAGRRSDVPVIGMDVFPTLLEAARVPPPDQPVDGVALLPLVRGERERGAGLHWHLPASTFNSTPAAALRDGRWKLVETFEDERVELFDLELDPGETRDLSSGQPERCERMLAQMSRWRASVGAMIPTRGE